MKKLSLGTKLALGFAGVLLLLMISTAVNYYNIQGLYRNFRVLTDTELPTSLTAKDLNITVQSLSQQVMAYAATRDARQPKVIREGEAQAAEYIAKLEKAAAANPELAPHVDKTKQYTATFNTMANHVLDAPDSVDPAQLVLMADNARNMGATIGRSVDEIIKLQDSRVAAVTTAAKARVVKSGQQSISLGIIALLVGLLMSFAIYRSITLPVRELATQLQEIAQGAGDLTKKVVVFSKDELGMLASNFNLMIEGLAQMVHQVVQASVGIGNMATSMHSISSGVAQTVDSVASSIQMVSGGAQDQSQSLATATEMVSELQRAVTQIALGAESQAVKSQQTSQLVSSMAASLQAVAQEAQAVAETSSVATRSAEQGASVIQRTLEGMTRLTGMVEQTAESVEALRRHSRSIANTLKTVMHMAHQTNLLALNAAIEAARVGEAGRGFAVVADEIRALASDGAESVKEIQSLLRNIEHDTATTVELVLAARKEAADGAQSANAAGSVLSEIVESMKSAATGMQRINAATQEMLEGTGNMKQAVLDTAAVIEENTAATEEMAAAADMVLNDVAEVSQVAQSNSRTAEEVAKSTAQMQEAVRQILASSEQLAVVSDQLRTLVGQFKV